MLKAISLPCQKKKKNLAWGLSNPTTAVKGKNVHRFTFVQKKKKKKMQ